MSGLLEALPLMVLGLAPAGGARTLPVESRNPLELEASSPVWEHEELLERVRESRHNYFRLINRAFATEVCRRFEPVMPSLPAVNLHGDAHLEQLAATPTSYGLHDFDDSASGPPVIDLVRFAVSVELALLHRGWQEHSDSVYRDFFEAYRLGLGENPEPPPPPSVVARLRSGFNADPSGFLDWAETTMRPVPAREKDLAERDYALYVDLMLRTHPDWSPSFLGLKSWGFLGDGGIGSARTRRNLVRIEGPSPAPEDDIILEAKELPVLDVPCITAQRGDALRVIAGTLGFAKRPDPFLAIVPRGPDTASDEPPWWIQSWSPAYAEIDLDESLRSATELTAVVENAAFQLAQGHTNLLPLPYERQLRELLMDVLDRQRDPIRAAVLDLTELTIDAHRQLIENAAP